MKRIFIGCTAWLLSITAFGQDSLRFSLEEARAYALEHSYYTRQAILDEEIASKRVKETTAIGLPQVSAEANFQNFLEIPLSAVPAQFGDPDAPEGTFVQVPFGTEYTLNGGVTVSQLLFDGSYFVGLRAARAYRELSANARVKSEQDIKDAVTIAYSDVLVARENVETLSGNKTYLEKTLTDTRALNEEGFVEEQDVEQLQILLASAENQYDNAVRFLEVTENMLKFQMGIPIERDIELTEDLDRMIEYGNEGSVLTQKFDFQSNIDYKLAKSNEELSRLNWKNTQAQYLPKLNAFYNYQRGYQANDLKLSENSDFWFNTSVWGLNLSVPIFSSGMRTFAAQQAKLDLEKSALQSEQVSQQLSIEYATARANYEFAMDRYRNNKNNLELVQRIVDKELVKYNEGVSTSLNLANTQLQFFDIQGAYIESTRGLIQAKSEMDKLLNNYR